MLQKDYYKILGLDRQATQQDIKKAFRRLAREYHPDVNKHRPDAQARFKEVAEAYEVLGDPERRKQYDGGHIDQTWFSSSSFDNIRDIFERTSSRQSHESAQHKSKFNFTDFLNNLADSVIKDHPKDTQSKSRPTESKSQSKTPPPAVLDIEQTLSISLEEAWNGTRQAITVWQEKTCALCGGTGLVKQQKCRNCQGKKLIRHEKRLDVKVPAGVRKGSKIRVPNEGRKHGDQQGHLYLWIEYKDHPFFDADEQGDLRCEVPLSVSEAILGAEIEVPTLGGRVKMKFPAGTQPGQVLRLRGKGLKHPKGQDPGDLYISTHVVIPKNLSERERQQYQQLAQSGEHLRRHLGG